MAVPSNAERRFELRLRPSADGGDWGFEVHETTGGRAIPVVEVWSRATTGGTGIANSRVPADEASTPKCGL